MKYRTLNHASWKTLLGDAAHCRSANSHTFKQVPDHYAAAERLIGKPVLPLAPGSAASNARTTPARPPGGTVSAAMADISGTSATITAAARLPTRAILFCSWQRLPRNLPRKRFTRPVSRRLLEYRDIYQFPIICLRWISPFHYAYRYA
jgi:hypothetical protein